MDVNWTIVIIIGIVLYAIGGFYDAFKTSKKFVRMWQDKEEREKNEKRKKLNLVETAEFTNKKKDE